MRNNYDIQAEQARELFLQYDQAVACRRLGLKSTDDCIFLRFLGEPVTIRRSDGQVFDSAGQPADFSTVMSVYDVLCRSKAAPVLKGEFVPITALNHIHGTHPVHEDFNSREAAFFAGKVDALRAACLRRGGTLWGSGDVSFILPIFDFFPVRLCFWDADEEFPASLQFFWDANALDFAHYETLWYMSGALTRKLMQEIILKPDENKTQNGLFS